MPASDETDPGAALDENDQSEDQSVASESNNDQIHVCEYDY